MPVASAGRHSHSHHAGGCHQITLRYIADWRTDEPSALAFGILALVLARICITFTFPNARHKTAVMNTWDTPLAFYTYYGTDSSQTPSQVTCSYTGPHTMTPVYPGVYNINEPSLLASETSSHLPDTSVYRPTTPSTPTHTRTQGKRVRHDGNSDAEDYGPVREALSPRSHRSPRKRRRRQTDQEKLSHCFSACKEVRWSFSNFLRKVFEFRDEMKEPIHNSKTHAQSLRQFLQGDTTFTPAQLIDFMFRHPYGRLSVTVGDAGALFATSPDWREIAPVRQALTAFAAQTVQKQLIREADEAVKPEAGLHATVPKSLRGGPESHGSGPKRSWSAIGSATFSNVQEIIQRCQPLTWQYALDIAATGSERCAKRHESMAGAVTASRKKYRPSHVVCVAFHQIWQGSNGALVTHRLRCMPSRH